MEEHQCVYCGETVTAGLTFGNFIYTCGFDHFLRVANHMRTKRETYGVYHYKSLDAVVDRYIERLGTT